MPSLIEEGATKSPQPPRQQNGNVGFTYGALAPRLLIRGRTPACRPRQQRIDRNKEVVQAIASLRRVVTPRIDHERVKPRVEQALFGFGFINPMMALPQLYNIFVSHHVSGLSWITIGSGLIMALLWTIYGLLGRQTVLWSTSAVWVLVHGVTLVGIAKFSQ